jgi:hypothetical protein
MNLRRVITNGPNGPKGSYCPVIVSPSSALPVEVKVSVAWIARTSSLVLPGPAGEKTQVAGSRDYEILSILASLRAMRGEFDAAP